MTDRQDRLTALIKRTRATARYQAQLATEAEKRGDNDQARTLRVSSRDNWRTAKRWEQD